MSWLMSNNFHLLVWGSLRHRLQVFLRGILCQRVNLAFAIIGGGPVRILGGQKLLLLELTLQLDQLFVFFFHQQNNFGAHDDFALPESVREKLLNRYLGLVRVKVRQKNFVSIFDKAIVTLGLELEPVISYELGNKGRVNQESVVNYG